MSTDKYNYKAMPNEIDRSGQYHTKEVRSEINFIPTDNEILSTYIARIILAIEQLDRKAWSQHVEGNKVWFCHRNIMGCFICQHTQFLFILRNAFKDLGELHTLSDYKFKLIQQEEEQPRWGIVHI